MCTLSGLGQRLLHSTQHQSPIEHTERAFLSYRRYTLVAGLVPRVPQSLPHRQVANRCTTPLYARLKLADRACTAERSVDSTCGQSLLYLRSLFL
jgi:hypothetical protein